MANELIPYRDDRRGDGRPEEPIDAILLCTEEPVPLEPVPSGPSRVRWQLPLVLFLLTCLSTLLVGGWIYAVCIMTILLCHEMGHFIQARRYRVPATLPFFIPLPISQIGTLGAVIAMSPRIPNRRALFDIGICGPLAGLVPTLIFSFIGLHLSSARPVLPSGMYQELGEPLLFKAMCWLVFGPLPSGTEVFLHPMAMAGWVGLLITALNLIPIGQLDGGHVLYSLLRRKAHTVAMALLVVVAVAIVVLGYTWWTLMLILLILMGPNHPPTGGDDVPLGTWRVILGWLTLALIPIGFTPNPFAL